MIVDTKRLRIGVDIEVGLEVKDMDRGRTRRYSKG